MLPGTWLTTPTNAPPFQQDLPLGGQFVDTYIEGGDGTIETIVNAGMVQAAGMFVGGVFGYLVGFGPSTASYARTLQIFFIQTQVYVFLLLDSFTPPPLNNEFFEPPIQIYENCGAGSVNGENTSFGSCASGAATSPTSCVTGTPTNYT